MVCLTGISNLTCPKLHSSPSTPPKKNLFKSQASPSQSMVIPSFQLFRQKTFPSFSTSFFFLHRLSTPDDSTSKTHPEYTYLPSFLLLITTLVHSTISLTWDHCSSLLILLQSLLLFYSQHSSQNDPISPSQIISRLCQKSSKSFFFQFSIVCLHLPYLSDLTSITIRPYNLPFKPGHY